MLVLTAFAIGVLSAATRSAFGCILAGLLIVAMFFLVTLVAEVSGLALVSALLAYNVGIAAAIVSAFIATPGHRA
ncbi:hypothetical protein [Rhizobium sp. Root482]|jgi:hypothetical protein|uniref:hypothetical protein n=1 Tax=Rhizobium sp. Root482 TaxID=1736543 RepID=UPI0006F3F888|nr:hypothetical protein [Rhizobium sp. Root482]KQY12661.1 hypothetical protein ASD31_15665 [Rhizobium sp. Root482]